MVLHNKKYKIKSYKLNEFNCVKEPSQNNVSVNENNNNNNYKNDNYNKYKIKSLLFFILSIISLYIFHIITIDSLIKDINVYLQHTNIEIEKRIVSDNAIVVFDYRPNLEVITISDFLYHQREIYNNFLVKSNENVLEIINKLVNYEYYNFMEIINKNKDILIERQRKEILQDNNDAFHIKLIKSLNIFNGEIIKYTSKQIQELTNQGINQFIASFKKRIREKKHTINMILIDVEHNVNSYISFFWYYIYIEVFLISYLLTFLRDILCCERKHIQSNHLSIYERNNSA
jgi:hypothetical protein